MCQRTAECSVLRSSYLVSDELTAVESVEAAVGAVIGLLAAAKER